MSTETLSQARVVQLSSSLGTRILSPLEARIKKPLVTLFLKNSQFLLSLITLIQKLQITTVYAQI
jgi:hypothetical protein